MSVEKFKESEIVSVLSTSYDLEALKANSVTFIPILLLDYQNNFIFIDPNH